MDLTRPVWLEIDLDKLEHNYKEIRNVVSDNTEIMAVVKADAYEHGAVDIVKSLMEFGVKRFGVAHLSEALHIRNHVKDAEILIMGYTPDYLMEKAISNNITMTIYKLEHCQMLSEIAQNLNKTAKVHLKIESGMNRLGFLPNKQSIEELSEICNMKNIYAEGIFTHFAASDDNFEYTKLQAERFNYVLHELEKKNIKIPLKHVSNSAAIMNFREYDYNMVRAGIILYGVYPFPNADRNLIKLKHIATLKGQISNVKELEKGEKISYGLIYETNKRTKVATVPIGYADGFSRALSNKGFCIIKDKIVPIVGRICMDQLMIDVTGLDVSIGDEAILMGESGDKKITIEEIADQIGQIPAAVMCMVTKRIPFIYKKNGEIINTVDYLLEL